MNMNGANPPVLMVHGWGGSHQETWHKSGVEELLNESGRTVIGVDLLGHGTAEKPHDPNSYSDISEPIRRAIGSRTTSVDAVGFSLGAIALLEATRINPNYFRNLMLVGIGDGLLAQHDERETQRIISGIDMTADPQDIVAAQFGNYARRSENDHLALRAVLMRPRPAPIVVDELKKVSANVQLVVGDKDFVLPADNLAKSFTNCHVVTLKNCDHFATPQHFGFIDALLEFFSEK